MKRAPRAVVYSTDQDSDSKEELVSHKRRKATIKLGKLHTANTTVLKKIMWPQELVYRPNSQPTVYDKLTLHLFISGYLVILESVKPTQKEAIRRHLNKLMADVEVYGWELVQVFHAIWLQQLENGYAD